MNKINFFKRNQKRKSFWNLDQIHKLLDEQSSKDFAAASSEAEKKLRKTKTNHAIFIIPNKENNDAKFAVFPFPSGAEPEIEQIIKELSGGEFVFTFRVWM